MKGVRLVPLQFYLVIGIIEKIQIRSFAITPLIVKLNKLKIITVQVIVKCVVGETVTERYGPL